MKAEELSELISKLEDNGETPFILIKNGPTVQMPAHLAAEQAVLFNISSVSVQRLIIDQEGISFNARFSGKEQTIYAPLDAVVRIQNRNGKIVINTAVTATPTNQPKVSFASNYYNWSTKEVKPVLPVVKETLLLETPKKITRNLTLFIGASMGDGQPRGKLQLVH